MYESLVGHPTGAERPMNEAQRQHYLKALGLTPWVARAPLPGAASSPLLDWDDEEEQPAAEEEAAGTEDKTNEELPG